MNAKTACRRPLLSCIFYPAADVWAQDTLVVGITKNQRAPYVERENGELSGGLLGWSINSGCRRTESSNCWKTTARLKRTALAEQNPD